MLLSTWIDKNGGTGKTGSLLGLKRNCVYAWRAGIALPRPEIMQKIVRKSQGKVTYDEMINEFVKGRTKKTTGKKKTTRVIKTKGKVKTASKKATAKKPTGKKKATPKKSTKKKSSDAGF